MPEVTRFPTSTKPPTAVATPNVSRSRLFTADRRPSASAEPYARALPTRQVPARDPHDEPPPADPSAHRPRRPTDHPPSCADGRSGRPAAAESRTRSTRLGRPAPHRSPRCPPPYGEPDRPAVGGQRT